MRFTFSFVYFVPHLSRYHVPSLLSAVSQVEHWLEKLHDKRRSLDVDCHERKTLLEKRLTTSLLVIDLDLLDNILSERRGALKRVESRLGCSWHECSELMEANANSIVEAKDIRDQALRVVKAAERLVLTKGYGEQDYKLRAYRSLELATDYLEELDRRERLLGAAIKFFETAEKVSALYAVHTLTSSCVLWTSWHVFGSNFGFYFH